MHSITMCHTQMSPRKLILLLLVLIVILVGWEALTRFLTGQDILPLDRVARPLTQDDSASITPEENLVIDIVERVGPSVITVAVENSPTPQDPFEFFFGPRQDDTNDEDPTETSIGSGFIVSRDGLVVTNKHVVANPDFSYIIIDDEENRYEVSNIYRDPLNDIAILQIENPPDNLSVATLGDSSDLQVGQHAIAIGTALGEFRNTVTTGVISGLGRGITAGSPFEGIVERLDNVIQTDAAISPGNSGGPLLNTRGEVIGVNTAVSRAGENIGFAIPINVIKESLENFENTGRFERPFLGVSYVEIDEDTAEERGVQAGVLVQEVIEGSAAAVAGVEVGDIITEIDGQKIAGEEGSLAAIIGSKSIGDDITLTVVRDEEELELNATLGTTPEE